MALRQDYSRTLTRFGGHLAESGIHNLLQPQQQRHLCQAHHAFGAKLAHQILTVRLYRCRAHFERFCYLLCRLFAIDELQHLFLALVAVIFHS